MGGPVRSALIPFNNLATYQSPGNPNLNDTGYQLAAKPGNLIDSVAAKYMSYMPLPNYNVGTPAYNPYTNWVGSPVTKTNIDSYDIKIDHRFSDRDQLSVKYSRSKNTQPPFPCYSATDPADPCTTGTNLATPHLVAINLTHTFAPALLLTVSYEIVRIRVGQLLQFRPRPVSVIHGDVCHCQSEAAAVVQGFDRIGFLKCDRAV